jgi:ferredoxin
MKVTIDNRAIDVPAGTPILDAAKKLGIDIPTLCDWPGCTPQTSCFVCVVKVNGAPRMVPSCATVVADGMEVESETTEVHGFRRGALELLLAEHCGDCFAPCQNVCPAHMDIPTMMRQIHSGNLRDAVATVKQAIPLPATLGRICPELCEKGCRRKEMDDAVSICTLKRYVGDKDLESGSPYLPACAPPSGKRVVIAGTGPAGLTAAWFLLQAGHAVTFFDGHPLPGGGLRYAIDEQRLPRTILDGEIGTVKALGAEFIMNTRVEGDAAPAAQGVISLTQLQHDFDAVLLAIGPVGIERAAALGVDYAGKGLKVDKDTLRTSRAGVFAAGSALLPAHYAIRAIADGQAAAHSIDTYLGARSITGRSRPFASKLGHLTERETAAFFAGVSSTPRIAPHRGLPQGLTDAEALAESARCGHCDCGKLGGCKLRRVAIQYHGNPARYKGARREFKRQDSHPLIIYEPGKCILCGICVELSARAAEPLGLTFVGRGFGIQVAAPLNATISEALQRTAAACAEACPTGALVLRGQGHLACMASGRPVRLPLPQLDV